MLAHPRDVVPLVLLATSVLSALPLEAQARTAPAAIVDAVDSLARRSVALGLTPGLGLAVVMAGRIVLNRGYGLADATSGIPADDRTLWYVASTSKSFTGFAVALLAERGALEFTTPITQLLPRASWHPDARAVALTLNNFLSHTHHLDDGAVVTNAAFTGAIPEDRWPALLAHAGPTGSPDLVYSNLGYNVAAMVIDQLHPKGWRDFLQHEVFEPAGMRETFSRVSGLDARRIAKPHDLGADGRFVTAAFQKADVTMNAAGGHLATMHDLARWTLVQMSNGRIDGRQVFPAAAVTRSHRLIANQTREAAKRFGPFDRVGWGAGWDIGSYEGEPMVSRFGSYHSTRSHLSFLPGRGIGVVAQVNGPGASGLTDLLARFAYDLEAGRAEAWQRANADLDRMVLQLRSAVAGTAAQDSMLRVRAAEPLGKPLERYTGTFTNPVLGAITVERGDSGFRFRWGVLSGPLAVREAARDQMRMVIAGNGTLVTYTLGNSPVEDKLTLMGREFTRSRNGS